jgi:Fur family ferric uptake transcriptional regulator
VRLRQIGQRYTGGRRQLVEALADAQRPLSAMELVRACQEIPLSTAYRNLAVLTQAGVAQRVLGHDEFARYELDEALTGAHHHHLVCRVCGNVEDFEAPPRFEESMDTLIGRASEGWGFSTVSHRVDLFGRCAACGG